MSRFALMSVGFHVMAVTLMTVSWPSFDTKDPNDAPLVIIDMVDIAEITNIAAQSDGTPQDDVDQEKARPKPPPPPPPPPPQPQAAAPAAPTPNPEVRQVDAAAAIL
ncbi:MAG: hypothetical protein ACON49_07650, partial [Candidatus Puniceispirillaceae bacterium]